MKFCWSTLTVKDLEESLKFYQDVVGLKIFRRFSAGPDTEIAFLGEGGTKIELIANRGRTQIDPGKDISLGFEVKSLEDTLKMVREKGIAVQSGPFEPNPHTRFFFVLDPSGFKIQFVENRS